MSEISIEKRFWNRVVRGNDKACWPWLGSIRPDGYGQIKVDGRTFLAHRLSYLVNIGIIPEGMTIDHQCENKSCVNPFHIEAVSAKTNSIRYENSRKPK